MEDLKSIAIKAEYEHILEALKKTRFSKSRAAKLLGIDRKTLYNKIDAYDRLNAKQPS
jgi:two-component system response regulator HydG